MNTQFEKMRIHLETTMKDLVIFLTDQRLRDLFSEDEIATFTRPEWPRNIRNFCDSLQRMSEPQNKYEIFRDVMKELGYYYFAIGMDRDLTREEEVGRKYASLMLAYIGHTSDIIVEVTESLLNLLSDKELINDVDREELQATLRTRGSFAARYGLFFNMITYRKVNWYIDFFCILHQLKYHDVIQNFDEDLWKVMTKFPETSVEIEIAAYFTRITEVNTQDSRNTGLPTSSRSNIVTDRAAGGDVTDRAAGGDVTDGTARGDVTDGATRGDVTYGATGGDVTYGATSDDVTYGGDVSQSFQSLNLAEFDQRPHQTCEKPILTLRTYQLELARPAIVGHNVLICAPTGSGKTYIAAYIILEHLKKDPSKRKVVFIESKLVLVTQQTQVLSDYLRPHGFKVLKVSGECDTASVLKATVDACHVVVLTADILLNAAKFVDDDLRVNSFTTFSLLIFDECHNCMKGHPYTRVMAQHLEERQLHQDTHYISQIVGLTASPGTSKTSSISVALDHLFTLCANLDTYRMQIVVESIAELKRYIVDPERDVICAPRRRPDEFEDRLEDLMNKAVDILIDLSKKGYFQEDVTGLITRTPEKGGTDYTSWVCSERVLLRTKTDPVECYRSVYAIFRFLKIYNEAHRINRLFEYKNAMDHIVKELMEKTSSPYTSEIESILINQLKESMFNTSLAVTPNPAILELKKRIIDQLMENKDSRIIVFMSRIIDTEILVKIFANDTQLSNIPVGRIVGTSKTREVGGLTQQDHKNVISMFKSGMIKVVFVTSVVEEGYDVSDCNLVICYSHVTNEIARMQSRGRARMLNSQFVLIIPFGEGWKERKDEINCFREGLMNKAIKEFINMDERDRQSRILNIQYELGLERQAKAERDKLRMQHSNQRDLHLYCIKCLEFVCCISEFRRVNDHHLLYSIEPLSNLYTVPIKEIVVSEEFKMNRKVFCKNCKQKWGSISVYNGVSYPCLAIHNFKLAFEEEPGAPPSVRPKLFTFKKWKDIPYKASVLDDDEIVERMHKIGNDWVEEP